MEMEHSPSDVCSQMPCQLDWCQLESNAWAFSSRKYKDELGYQRTIMCESVVNIKLIVQFLLSTSKSFESYLLHTAAASVVSMFPTVKWRIQSVMEKMSTSNISLVQFWAPIKVNGSAFLSTADQTFAFYKGIDKRLSSYRKLCLDTLIPIDDYTEIRFGPIERVYTRCLPEYNPDVSSYSAAEFSLLELAIRLGIHSYYAVPVFNNYDQQYRGVLEIVSTQPSLHLSHLITPPVDDRLDKIKNGLYEILERDSLPFAQIWIPYSPSVSLKVLYRAAASIYERSSSMYLEFEHVSEVCFIESGAALVGRAFASQGSCFCKDVTLLSISEYPLVLSARKVRFTQSFAICLQSKCADNSVYVVEYFLPPNKMSARDTRTFINMLLSTTKERLPGFVVAPGKELGQRMLVEVVKVSPSDEFDSFEIGQSLPSVESLQDGGGTTEFGQRLLSVQSLQDVGETTEIDSFCQQSNNVVAAAALLVPSCSADKRDSLNCERTVEVDLLLPHPIEEAVTNSGKVNLDVAHDDHIEDTLEIMQLDSHFEQPNIEINSAGNAMTNNNKIYSHKKNTIQRIEKDYGITRKILEHHFGRTLQDAAKNLHVSQATLKRICKEYEITRWPNYKTRKVNVHVNQGVSFQGAEPYVVNQQCPALSQEKGTDYLGHKISPAIGKPCDGVMTVKVTYRGDIIKFQLSLSSTRVELEGEVEKRLEISLERFSIKYQDEGDDWILISSDSDLRDRMHSLRLLGRTTMRLLVTPEADT